MRVTSLGYRTDLALRALEGGTETDRGGYLVVRNPALPDFWWGNFLLLAQPPEPDSAGDWLAAFTAEFPEAQHVAIGLDTASSQDADPAPFVAAGLEYERNLVLTAAPGEVHEPPRPSRAATLRPLTSERRLIKRFLSSKAAPPPLWIAPVPTSPSTPARAMSSSSGATAAGMRFPSTSK